MFLRTFVCLAMITGVVAQAGEITVMALDARGEPLAQVAVTLKGPASLTPQPAKKAEVSQINTQFTPHVLIVPRLTDVSFPNLDNTRHQVYSFSAAKRFTTNLFAGREAEPVNFDQPGLVPIGCNIHDRMHAYIYVTDAPRYGISDSSGTIRFDNLPAGEYRIEALHPWQLRGGTIAHNAVLRRDTQKLDISINLGAIGPDPRIPRRQNTNPLIRSNPFAR
jgi:plastocyanin